MIDATGTIVGSQARGKGSAVTAGVLIAGGGSRRMGGLDKRYLVLDGRTLLVRGVRFLQGIFDEVGVVVAREGETDLGDAAGVRILRDAWPGRSPLVGIATALAAYRRPVFVLAADLAYPDADIVREVCAALAGHDVAMPAIGAGFREPLFAAYGPACLIPMEDLIRAGRHRIVDIFPRVRVAEVPIDERRAFRSFRNINTIDDYAAVRTSAPAVDPRAAPPPARLAVAGDAAAFATVARLLPELQRLGMRVALDGADVPAGVDLIVSVDPGAASVSPPAVHCVEVLDEMVGDAAKESAGCARLQRAGAGAAALAVVSRRDVGHPHRFTPEDMAGLARFLAVRLDTLRAAGGEAQEAATGRGGDGGLERYP